MNQDGKVVMMIAAGKALGYKKQNPGADHEEILKHVMNNIHGDKESKINAIVAANRALKYIQENPELGDKKVMQKIMDELDEISSIN
jgi:hypothetical protein